MKPMSTFHLFTKMLYSHLMVYWPYEKQVPFSVHSYTSISKHNALLKHFDCFNWCTLL